MEEINKYPELDFYFNNMDHIDVKTITGDKDLRNFISGVMSYNPKWLMFLYKIRGLLVKVFGLVKHEIPKQFPSTKPKDISFTKGDNASFFIVSAAKENKYWVVESPKDKHLKAYLGIVAEELRNGETKFFVFTSVKYLHWTGSFYFNLIRPFHHIVVSKMIKNGIRS